MKKLWYILSGVILIIVCFIYITAVGNRYVIQINLSNYTGKVEQLQVHIDQDNEIIQLTDQ